MQIQAPRNGRELLEAFRLYDPEKTLGKMLDRMDWKNVTPRQVHFAATGRLPAAQGCRVQPGYNPRGQMRHLLHAEEFQKRLMARTLEAFPEKRRLLFVHVPKCAGSNLSGLLKRRYAAFDFRLLDREWMPPEKMFTALRTLVTDLAFSDGIFVFGHVPLKYYVSNNMVRFGDAVFTTIRDPADMVVSAINYMLARFAQDPGLNELDTRGWLPFINHERLMRAIESGDLRDAANEILFAHGLLTPNTICVHLGDGTAESAFDLCTRADIEIAHFGMYQQWLQVRWGIAPTAREQPTGPRATLDMLGADAVARVAALTVEDQIFAARVAAKLGESGRSSIFGTELGD